MLTLIFATNNQNKIKEISSILGNAFTLLSLKDAGIEIDIPEPWDTLEDNAKEKSGTIVKLTQQNCFSEDTKDGLTSGCPINNWSVTLKYPSSILFANQYGCVIGLSVVTESVLEKFRLRFGSNFLENVESKSSTATF